MKRSFPRSALAHNLSYLMRRDKMSEATLARRSGVAQKTINNIRNGISVPTLDTVESLAAAFSISSWHLILPNLPDDLIASREVEAFWNNYVRASQAGRRYIHHAAEREAEYLLKEKPP